jgi:hypothetical protein
MDFKQAEKRFKQLKAQFEARTLTETEFRAQLEELMIQDEQGSWWMIGYETELWYRHNGTNWVQTDLQGGLSLKSKPEATLDVADERKIRDGKGAKISSQPTEEASTLETSEATLTASSNAISWFTLGWAIAGGIGGYMYNIFNEITGGATGGLIGGLVVVTSLQAAKIVSPLKNTMRILLAWVLGGAIGWLIGWELTEAIGAGIGMAIFVTIGMAGTFGMDYIRSHWKSIAVITLAWLIGGAIGWSISKGMIDGLYIDYATSWVVGTAIGWGIGGFVMGRQLMDGKKKL